MKIIPSIFFALIIIVVSCNHSDIKKENTNPVADRISLFIESGNQEGIPFIEKKSALDSAIVLSKTIKNDSLLLKSLSHKASIYFYHFPDSSKVHIGELEKMALKKNSQKHWAYASSLYGNYFYNRLEYDSAYYYYKNSNVLYFEKQDSLRMAYNLIMMARIHQFINDYSSSEELATEALDYLKNPDYSDYIIEAYNILGHTYLNTKNFEEAIKFYDKSLEFDKDAKEQIILKNNKASVYIYLGKYELALQMLNELFQSENINENLNAKSLILFNIGYARFKLDKTEGLKELEESLQIRDSIDNWLGSIESHIRLAEYFEDKEKETAREHLRKAIDLATKYHNIDNELNALKMLIHLSDKDDLKYYSQEYIRLNDSIIEMRQKAKNQFAKIRYDYSKELEQNLLLKTKTAEDELFIQKQKNTNQLLFFGLLFMGGFGIFLYSIIRNRHKREKIKETYKTENRIAVKIHDELANDVYNVMAYTENSDLSVGENRLKLLDDLEDVYNRTRNISKENSTLDTGVRYVETLKNMLSEYQKNELKIIIAGIEDIDWTYMNSHKKIVTYRVLQELMVNMKKHSGASIVMIRFENKNKQVNIHYSDNGIGLPDEKIIFKNGLQNVENRIKTINGTITFDPKAGKGLKILIAFPL